MRKYDVYDRIFFGIFIGVMSILLDDYDEYNDRFRNYYII